MKLRTAILLFDQVEVLDFAGPYEVPSRARTEPGVESRRTDDTAPFEVFTLAREVGPLRTTGGLQVTPDATFADVGALDVLVVPGGFGTRPLLEDEEFLAWLRARAEETQHLASVCTGALLLARAGLLADRRATTHWCALDSLRAIDASIDVQAEERVVDDGILTAAGVSAGIDMALALVERVCGRAVADETAHYIEYRRAPQT